MKFPEKASIRFSLIIAIFKLKLLFICTQRDRNKQQAKERNKFDGKNKLWIIDFKKYKL